MSFSLGQNFKNRSNPRERERERRSTLRGERVGFLRLRLSARVRERRRQKTPHRNRSIDFAMCAFLHTQIIESAFFSKITKNDRILQSEGEEFHSFVSLSFSSDCRTRRRATPNHPKAATRAKEKERERDLSKQQKEAYVPFGK